MGTIGFISLGAYFRDSLPPDYAAANRLPFDAVGVVFSL
jgi:hypothetical protein